MVTYAEACHSCGRRARCSRSAARYARGEECNACHRSRQVPRRGLRGPRAAAPQFAAALAELRALTEEHGWVTRRHWEEARVGSGRTWNRLLRRMRERGVPHDARVVLVPVDPASIARRRASPWTAVRARWRAGEEDQYAVKAAATPTGEPRRV